MSPPSAADVERIVVALRTAGVLKTGHVLKVTPTALPPKLRSLTFRLRLQYEPQVPDAPASLILKTGHLDADGRPAYANAREIAFYRDIAPALQRGWIPRCYEAVEATTSITWSLLLEDLTDSHFIATSWPIPPSLEQCQQIVQVLARIHSALWDDPRLGKSLGTWYDNVAREAHVQEFTRTFEKFMDRFGNVLPPERRDLYGRLIDRAPRLLARYRSKSNVTIVHGDAHFWNFFLPRAGAGGGVRLLDWENWGIDTATHDLAYVMAMLWYPDRRRRYEQMLLDRYYDALTASGLNGYSRVSLADDYRLSALWLITRPIWQAMAGIGGGVWWNNLERIFLAIDDLECRDLLA
jgi:thiamine kinase-like enzyme